MLMSSKKILTDLVYFITSAFFGCYIFFLIRKISHKYRKGKFGLKVIFFPVILTTLVAIAGGYLVIVKERSNHDYTLGHGLWILSFITPLILSLYMIDYSKTSIVNDKIFYYFTCGFYLTIFIVQLACLITWLKVYLL